MTNTRVVRNVRGHMIKASKEMNQMGGGGGGGTSVVSSPLEGEMSRIWYQNDQ